MTWYAVPDEITFDGRYWAVSSIMEPAAYSGGDPDVIAYGITLEADARRIAAALNYLDVLLPTDQAMILRAHSEPYPRYTT